MIGFSAPGIGRVSGAGWWTPSKRFSSIPGSASEQFLVNIARAPDRDFDGEIFSYEPRRTPREFVPKALLSRQHRQLASQIGRLSPLEEKPALLLADQFGRAAHARTDHRAAD